MCTVLHFIQTSRFWRQRATIERGSSGVFRMVNWYWPVMVTRTGLPDVTSIHRTLSSLFLAFYCIIIRLVKTFCCSIFKASPTGDLKEILSVWSEKGKWQLALQFLWHTDSALISMLWSWVSSERKFIVIVWQPRCAADTSTNWRQSLFCCCTASMEQVTDGAETAAIDGLVSSWSENISVSFCLRAWGLTLWCALGLLVGGAIRVHQLQLQLRIAQ